MAASTPSTAGVFAFAATVQDRAARAVEDMFEHPQVLAQGLVAEYEHPAVGRYRGFRAPIDFGRTPPAQVRAAPVLGEHTDEIRAEARLSGKG